MHPDKIITTGTAYFGTDTGDWIPADHITTDGIQLDPATETPNTGHQITKTVSFDTIDANHNMIALMFGIEGYNQLRRIQAIANRQRYWHDFSNQPRRNPLMRPLLHNGKTPR